MPVKKKWGKKRGKGPAPQRESLCWVLCLEGFLSLWQGGTLGRSQGRVSAEYFQFSRCPFRVVVSSYWSVAGQGVLVIAVGPGVTHLVCCSFGPGAEIELRSRCFLQGGESRGGEVTWG